MTKPLSKPITSKNCIKIGQLIKFLQKFPKDGEVWVETGSGVSSPVLSACRCEHKDVILQTTPWE